MLGPGCRAYRKDDFLAKYVSFSLYSSCRAYKNHVFSLNIKTQFCKKGRKIKESKLKHKYNSYR